MPLTTEQKERLHRQAKRVQREFARVRNGGSAKTEPPPFVIDLESESPYRYLQTEPRSSPQHWLPPSTGYMRATVEPVPFLTPTIDYRTDWRRVWFRVWLGLNWAAALGVWAYIALHAA
jgi:hypothetical protein